MITAKALIDLTRYRIPGGIDEPKVQTYAFQVGSWIPTALHRLCTRICRSADRAKVGLITKEFPTVTLSSGVADVSASTYDNALFEFLPDYGTLLHTSSNFPLTWVNSETELRLRQPMQGLLIHYTINGKRIQTKNTDGSLTSLAGVLIMRVPFVPLITQNGANYDIDLPEALVDDAVDILQEIFTGKMDVGVVLAEGATV